MTFLERERKRLSAERDHRFKDPGLGVFAGKPREFVLSEPALNLWEGIRADAVEYFDRNEISWWRGEGDGPSGHMLSSQVACVNHLYPLRQQPDLASAVLAAIDPEIIGAEIVDDGYVEFEFIGKEQYLKERGFSRGAHCTSVDAFMIGRTKAGERRAFLIEWKYTESYRSVPMYIPERAKVYDALIESTDSPLKKVEQGALYFEPFYQLMRQTLLGWQLCANKNDHYTCTSYRHIHVAPEQNADFHNHVTAPTLKGASVSDAWRSVLKRPDLYVPTSPPEFMRPLAAQRDTKSLREYLAWRYWSAE
jgi:hypothetical protein